jgi:dipeptidyl aminopeptidase/acylaminoacyl peptidase
VKRHVLDLETLVRVPYVESEYGFDISPDGKQIAFSWNPSGRWEIYLLPLDSPSTESGYPPEESSLHQITSGPGAKHAPRWSPDGRRLAYVLDLDGGELYDVYIYDFATRNNINLTPDTSDAILPNFCWSPDGNVIAFISDRAGRFDTYVMPSGSGSVHRILDLPYPDWKVQWSPDGHWLAIVAETHGQDFGTFIVPAKGGEPRPIADDRGPICAKDAFWSPDSRWIAFSSDLHGYFNLGLFELSTGKITWVTEGKGDKESPVWSPDGRQIAYLASDGPVTKLATLELRTPANQSISKPSLFQIEPGVCYWPRYTPDGSHLAFIFDNPRHPNDIWMLSLQTEPFNPELSRGIHDVPQDKLPENMLFQQLTHSLPSEMDRATLTMPTTINYPSLDGARVPALLYRPTNTEDLPPAIVYIHGGPGWLTQVTWDPLVQHMISRGWVVLAPNYRGSTGYGREWQLANRFDLGGVDTMDVVAGADHLAQENIADPKRIAATGRSWGGYLTMTCLTQYPDRWAAGSAVVPFLNWFTAHANSREDLQHWDRENFGDPEENYDLWHERSPFFFLDRVEAPVQLICSAHDVRCPASEAVQARDILSAQGKVCDFVLYSDEGHGFLKIENLVDVKRRRATFLAQILENDDVKEKRK